MNKAERWMENLKEPALRQALRFILEASDMEMRNKNIRYIQMQIEEFAKMYPDYEGELN